MTKRWTGVFVLAMALTAYGCGGTNGGDLGGSGGSAGTGGAGGTGGTGGTGGAGGMAGSGGTGGTVDLCMGADCSDGNDCTADACDSADGTCSNPNEADGTACNFGGAPGICASGTCEDAMLCAGVDCSDGNECTMDLCDPADGACSNPAEADGTTCDFNGVGGICMSGTCEDAMLCADAATRCDDVNECTQDACDPVDGACSNTAVADGTVCDFGGVGGVCMTGACADAMLCADAATRCDDGNECTQDDCDPVDGACSNTAVADGTVCDFSGVGGVCTAGVCEDAMLCADAATRCDDGNACTQDACDPVDGACSNPNEMDGTACNAGGLPGTCGGGVCTASCGPSAGISVSFPTSGAPTPVYTNTADGFTISAPVGYVTFSLGGIGANANGSASAMEENDRLTIEFFDSMGTPRTASNVSILLHPGGASGSVLISIDDGPQGAPVAAVPGSTIDIAQIGMHKIDVEVPDLDPAVLYWQGMTFDHDCL